jgi:hypothetical protein
MSVARKLGLGALVVLIGCGLGYRAIFPYGQRPCTVSCLMSALRTYAEDHNGEFPHDLAELYPNYTNYQILAGLSGNVTETKKALEERKPIKDLTSWRYRPGMKKDADQLIVYDMTTKSDAGGKRLFSAGRYAGFSDGTVKRVPIPEWDAFLKQQKWDDLKE